MSSDRPSRSSRALRELGEPPPARNRSSYSLSSRDAVFCRSAFSCWRRYISAFFSSKSWRVRCSNSVRRCSCRSLQLMVSLCPARLRFVRWPIAFRPRSMSSRSSSSNLLLVEAVHAHASVRLRRHDPPALAAAVVRVALLLLLLGEDREHHESSQPPCDTHAEHQHHEIKQVAPVVLCFVAAAAGSTGGRRRRSPRPTGRARCRAATARAAVAAAHRRGGEGHVHVLC